MIFEEQKIKGVFIIYPEGFEDNRGYFNRKFCISREVSSGFSSGKRWVVFLISFTTICLFDNIFFDAEALNTGLNSGVIINVGISSLSIFFHMEVQTNYMDYD